MASVTITSPSSGATVSTLIGANGTYTSGAPTPAIVVNLKNSAGATVASTNAMLSGGNWFGSLSAPQTYTDASLEAVLDGGAASDSVGGLTVT